MEFRRGEVKQLAVVGIRESNESKYIYLSDGLIETYRVKPYAFQTEWDESNLPNMMSVFVADINIMNGLPFLQQWRKEVLEHCYTEPDGLYDFKVVAVETDISTQAQYYQLKDSYGITHRYYPKPNEPVHEVNDLFLLQVGGVEYKGENNAYLVLTYPEDKRTELRQPLVVDEGIASPRKNFGSEDHKTEFKSTIVFPAGDIVPDIDKQMQYILKIIAGFQNSDGGQLYLGVNDAGIICGINRDYEHLNTSQKDPYNNYRCNTDGYESKIRSAVRHVLGRKSNSNISFEFGTEELLDYCCITVNKLMIPVFVDGYKLFQRAGNMTQLLAGDEITWFIEERMIERNKLQNQNLLLAKQDGGEQSDEQENDLLSVLPEKASVRSVYPEQLPVASLTDNLWFFITFFKNGEWSYQDAPVSKDEDVIFELPIPKSMKKERLLMAYTNGRINIVTPYDIIKPTRPTGKRKYRTQGKRYKNGWNTEAELLNVFLSRSTDLVAIQSENEKGDRYLKLHNVTAISIHVDLHSAGNVVVNDSFKSKTIAIDPLSGVYRDSLASLIAKDYQRSLFIGFNQKDRNVQNNLNALRKVLVDSSPRR